MEADGGSTAFEYTAKYDGKDYPVKGSDLFDTIGIKKENDRTVTATLKKSGQVLRNARRVVSADGKTLTITMTGTDETGQKSRNVGVTKSNSSLASLAGQVSPLDGITLIGVAALLAAVGAKMSPALEIY